MTLHYEGILVIIGGLLVLLVRKKLRGPMSKWWRYWSRTTEEVYDSYDAVYGGLIVFLGIMGIVMGLLIFFGVFGPR